MRRVVWVCVLVIGCADDINLNQQTSEIGDPPDPYPTITRCEWDVPKPPGTEDPPPTTTPPIPPTTEPPIPQPPAGDPPPDHCACIYQDPVTGNPKPCPSLGKPCVMPKDECVAKGPVEMVTKNCVATTPPAAITCTMVDERRMVHGNCPDQAGCPDGARSDTTATGCKPPCKYVEKLTNKWVISCGWSGTAYVTRPIACEAIRRAGQDGWDFDGGGCISTFAPNGTKQCNGTCVYATRTRANNCEPAHMNTACVLKTAVPVATSCTDSFGNPAVDCEQ